MKILIISLLLISTQARAQDAVACATKASNRALFLKMNTFIAQNISDIAKAQNETKELPHDYNPFEDPKVTAEMVCSSGETSFFEETSKSKKLILKRFAEDVRVKGKVSQNALNGIDAFADKDMTQKEVCESLELKATDLFDTGSSNSSCRENASEMTKAANSMNLLNKNFKEACLAMYPKVKKYRSRERTCDDEEPKVVEKELNQNEVKTTKKTEQKNLPGVNEGSFKYLRPGASAQ